MKQLFPLHASIMVENFSDIILDYEITLLSLKENSVVCSYDNYLLEINADSLQIKSLSANRLHLTVEQLNFFNLTRKDRT
ncbi:hypothetical protein [Bacillus sp. FJAT-22090]|uniref:hypothetical protein n=1 Tax=Bacillus sp. FJAT-22090 TaxID=1581038 RepID=UPI00119FE9BA|nr:hypothetical protein [Bacillus sp. FJAT-22090]